MTSKHQLYFIAGDALYIGDYNPQLSNGIGWSYIQHKCLTGHCLDPNLHDRCSVESVAPNKQIGRMYCMFMYVSHESRGCQVCDNL